MKIVLVHIVIALFCTTVSHSQTFTDIAAAQNINEIQNYPFFGNGMSFYDFDEDGWDDLTFPTQNDSIAFYKNYNGNFVKIGSMLYAPGEMRQLLWVDYDDNGTLDICISYGDIGVRLYDNDGAFNFSDVTTAGRDF